MSDGSVTGEQQWFGHPRGLSTLFATEMWERLSYYGMRALLILFMTSAAAAGGLGMTDGKAAAIYGLYVAGVYLFALPGGWVADRLIGQQRAVFVGGCFITAGHFTMALPIVPGLDALFVPSFYVGLVLIVLGTGLLKPNVSAIVGELYKEKGGRRDAGFSIFYMGINVGAFAGPLLCGWLGEKVDWHLGFGTAGIGMFLGLVQYKLGLRHLGDAGTIKSSGGPAASALRQRDWSRLYAGIGAVAVAVVALVLLRGPLGLDLERVASLLGYGISALAVTYFISVIFFAGLDTQEKKRVFVIFLLFVGAALFWSGFEQAGSSMNLFAERHTDRNVLGWEAPASWLQSVNPLFIILLAPVFGWLWVFLGSREPSIPFKFGFGLITLGIGFLVMSWGSTFIPDTPGGVSPNWLVVTYFLHTVGELCLSPVGLSSVTKLSPRRLVGQMMGTWFMGTALGNLIAGLVAGRIESMPLPSLFGTVAMFVIVAGAFFVLFTIPIKRMIGDLEAEPSEIVAIDEGSLESQPA